MTFEIKVLLALALPILAAVLFFAPLRTHAAIAMSSTLGGGNSLLRAGTGISNANPESNVISRLTFAGTRGGQPETTPADENSNTGGTTSSDQSDGDNGADASSAGGAGGNGGNNGGATAGNGGNGGNGGGAAPGGLVHAGSGVSNANALNAINVTIIRITR